MDEQEKDIRKSQGDPFLKPELPGDSESFEPLEPDLDERSRVMQETQNDDGILIRTYFPHLNKTDTTHPTEFISVKENRGELMSSTDEERQPDDQPNHEDVTRPHELSDEELLDLLDKGKVDESSSTLPMVEPAYRDETPQEDATQDSEGTILVQEELHREDETVISTTTFQEERKSSRNRILPAIIRMVTLPLILIGTFFILVQFTEIETNINQIQNVVGDFVADLPVDIPIADSSDNAGDGTPFVATAGALLDPTEPAGGVSEEEDIPETPTETSPLGVTAFPTETPTPGPTVTPFPTATVEGDAPSTEQIDNRTLLQGAAVMLLVDAGTFWMGSDSGDINGPGHTVSLSAFYIDKFEVTNALWSECVAAGVCNVPSSVRDYQGNPYFGEEVFADYPVIYVDWFSAQAYCEWRGARLPTEAEWEYAASWNPETESVRIFPWGDDVGFTRVNFCDTNCPLSGANTQYDDGFAMTSLVGSYPNGASYFGMLDMAGNVAEWVSDWFDANYYNISPETDPTGPESGTLKVVRGGAWGVSVLSMQNNARSRFEPSATGPGIGFRCAISADAVEE